MPESLKQKTEKSTEQELENKNGSFSVAAEINEELAEWPIGFRGKS